VAARVAELLADREAGPQGYLSVDAAAQFLACPKSGIYALASAGRIPVHRDGSRLLFRASEPRVGGLGRGVRPMIEGHVRRSVLALECGNIATRSTWSRP
jgi:excisionase family DNA binding protein